MKLTTLSYSMRLAMTGMFIVGACTATPWASAFGLGQANVQSGVGESLVADIELLTQTADMATLKMSLAPASEYLLQGIEFNPALLGARVTVKNSKDGKPVAQIVTNSSIRDPYVQVIVDGDTAAGKVRRTYSLFIDPNKRTMTRLPGESALSELARPVAALPVIKALQAEPTVALLQPALGIAGNRDDAYDLVLTNVAQNGTAPGRIEIVKLGGKNQPIRRALSLIVPKGWKGYATDPAVKLSGAVDWQGNRSWLIVLDGVLSSAQLMATVEWDRKEVVFSSINFQAGQAPAISAVITPSVTSAASPQTVPVGPESSTDSETPLQGSATQASAQPVQPHDMQSHLAAEKASMEPVKAEHQQTILALIEPNLISDIGAQAMANKASQIIEIGALKERQQELQMSLQITQAALIASQINEAAQSELRMIGDQAAAQNNAAVKSELETAKANALEFEEKLKTSAAHVLHYRAQIRGLEAALVRSEASLEALIAQAKIDNDKVLSAETNAKRLAEENKSLRKALADAHDELALSRNGRIDLNSQKGN